MKKHLVTVTLTLLFAAALFIGGGHMGFYETPQYTTQSKEGPIELRQYPGLLVAEVSAEGSRDMAVRTAFRKLAGFIFGNNQPQSKIAMTSPVLQEQGSKIAMTTPVMQEPAQAGWKIRFVMPQQYTLQTLPKPNSPDIHIYETPARKVLAIRFSWFTNDRNFLAHENKLRAYAQEKGLKTAASATYAYYDPPWTLPFFRRNEVLLDLQ